MLQPIAHTFGDFAHTSVAKHMGHEMCRATCVHVVRKDANILARRRLARAPTQPDSLRARCDNVVSTLQYDIRARVCSLQLRWMDGPVHKPTPELPVHKFGGTVV